MDTKDWKGGPWSQVGGNLTGPWTWDGKQGRFPQFCLLPGTEVVAHLGLGAENAYANVPIRFVDGGGWEVT